MRLTAIRLAGFKSFVDRTELRLSSNLTAIVGPNGCGKSNLIDAVRWVLGESSARQLRGTSLEDVIFTGSRTRKPVGRASIELVFDNSDQTLGGAWGAYAEIAVRRELTRDGQSNFSINGQRCRRKDVTELFLGTGLGPRANYAIIEQGTISRLVEAQPDDLRQMIEEVAGVSRYKEKRRETETRIRHTRENLERLNDIIVELDERLGKLRRQVSAAQRYKELRTEQRGLRAAALGLRWNEMGLQREDSEARIRAVTEQADQQRHALADAIVALRTAEEHQAQVAQQGQAADAAFYASQAELARLDQALQHQQQMRVVRERERNELQAEAQRLQRRLEEARSEHVRCDSELQELDTRLAADAQREAEAEALQTQLSTELATAQTQLLQARAAAEGPRTQQAQEQARLEQLERQQVSLLRRLEALESERQRALAAQPTADPAVLEQAATEASGQQELAQQKVEAAAQTLKVRREHLHSGEAQARQAQSALSEARALWQVLNAEQTRSLQPDDEQADLADLQVLGRLGELLQVPEEREQAVEAVLRDWLRAPLIVDLPQPEVPPGLSVLVGAAQSSATTSPENLAWGVTAPSAAQRWLAQFEFAVDAPAAQQRLAAGAAAVVTADGALWWADAARGRPRTPDGGGVLRRQRALEAAQREFQSAEDAAQTAEAARRAAQAALQEAEATWSAAGKALDEARRARSRADEELLRLQAAMERQHKQLVDLNGRVEATASERVEIEAEIAQVSSRRAEAAQILEQAAAQSAEAEQQWRTVQSAHAQAAQTAQALRQSMARMRQQRDELARRRAAAESAVASQTQGLEQVRAGMSRAEQALAEVGATVVSADSRDTLAAQFARHQRERQDAQALSAAAAEQRTQAQQLLERLRTENDAALQAVQTAQLERERLRSRQEALREQIEEQGLTLEAVQAAVSSDQSLQTVQELLDGIERKLARIGPVNLAAVEEFAEESRRADDMRAQDADLRSALEQLETAMAQIDRETRALFRQTFSEVNTRFSARFPRLFGGGEAGLELLGDDVLNAGVRVMARPPGKRNASIALLSGGEKALTAVALVFALFELNPAPFCMLDEVDAPLDDANVVRFCEVVREMSTQVQFILVTHNKVTMEMADALHGVTMQEAGVSRLVGVDVSAAVAMTAETA